MLVKERQDKIYEMIKASGAVETSKLAKYFNTSIETIRKDFLMLENLGLITKTHGGAVLNSQFTPRYNLSKRLDLFSDEKRNLALKAAEFICENDIIAIDEGSTAIVFSEVLKEKFSKLTIITYSIDVFNILCNHKDFDVILCGGNYLKNQRFFYGAQTLTFLETFNWNKTFIFPSAVSLEFGICSYDINAHILRKKLLDKSAQTYILADSSKFEKKALRKISAINGGFTFITDNKLSEEIKKSYMSHNINVVIGD